ncbi:single-stranded DNA-binding protein [Romboutsia sp.]|uniref:single-stranded DNA-binding protein n=1 Tax=Romboutsia sp. TaxID=1965302 RepID=UPI002BBF5923|nr:single-stranded DNA-binding protein [Romboutsia sp.]HSQ88358.1 single-stranded DNA-binding protein [Romboutsia sp.]
MNNVILVGRLTKDPEVKYVGESNHLKAEFSIAVNRDYIEKDGTRGIDFIPIEIWGRQAELCAQYLHKGRQVGIEGRILIEKYKNKNGENRVFTKVKANSFKFLDSKKEASTNKYFESVTVFESVEDYDKNVEEILPF